MGSTKRILRWLAWACLLGSTAILALFFASGWSVIWCEFEDSTGNFQAVFTSGGVLAYTPARPTSVTPPPFSIDVTLGGKGWDNLRDGLWFGLTSEREGYVNLQTFPLMPPAVMLLVISLILWLAGRRAPGETREVPTTSQSAHRTRSMRLLKRGATAAAAVLVLMLFTSGWLSIGMDAHGPPNTYRMGAVVDYGAITLSGDVAGTGRNAGFHLWFCRQASYANIDDALRFDWRTSNNHLEIVFPVLVPIGIAAGIAIFAWRRDRARREGLCQRCGYDLTANTTGRCPECGATAKLSQRATGAGKMPSQPPRFDNWRDEADWHAEQRIQELQQQPVADLLRRLDRREYKHAFEILAAIRDRTALADAAPILLRILRRETGEQNMLTRYHCAGLLFHLLGEPESPLPELRQRVQWTRPTEKARQDALDELERLVQSRLSTH